MKIQLIVTQFYSMKVMFYVIISLLHTRKSRRRDVEKLAQSHKAKMYERQDNLLSFRLYSLSYLFVRTVWLKAFFHITEKYGLVFIID